MKKNNQYHKQGFAISTLIAVVSLVSLFVSGTKVATHVYEKNETEEIAEQFEEQSQHLADRAKDMGAGGDEAVRESLRLNQAAKDIREHGTLVYQQKMVGEAVSMTKSLVTGKVVGAAAEGLAKGAGATAEAAKELSDVSGALLDADGIEQELQQAEKVAKEPMTETKEGKKLHELIKGSRSNVDDFNMAQVKAMTDELINMREDLEKMGNEIEDWIAIREQALKDLEQAAYLRRLKQRERSRLAVLENDDLNQMLQQDLSGEETPIDVVKAMSGKSVEEWEQAQKEYEKKVEETKRTATEGEISGKLSQKSLSKEKVIDALKKAKEELGWAYYSPPTPNSKGGWNNNINKYPPAGEMWQHYISVKFITEAEKAEDRKMDDFLGGSYFDGWNSSGGSKGEPALDIVPGANTYCNSSDLGGELRIYLQNNWLIKTYKRGSYDCGGAYDYLKVFWKYL